MCVCVCVCVCVVREGLLEQETGQLAARGIQGNQVTTSAQQYKEIYK